MSGFEEALMFEREGYVRRGLDDRVAQVDAELARVRAAAPPADTTADEPPADTTAAAAPTDAAGDSPPADAAGSKKRRW